jgi:hypothetical protein
LSDSLLGRQVWIVDQHGSSPSVKGPFEVIERPGYGWVRLSTGKCVRAYRAFTSEEEAREDCLRILDRHINRLLRIRDRFI